MKPLEFIEITSNMAVLYKKDDDIFATRVTSTTHGHPSVPLVRLNGGFVLWYQNNRNELYADNAINRTELLLEDTTILTDLN